jgi:hypothetical protein
MMAVFGFGSYRLVKVCVRGMCSAVTGDDMVCVHGCALSLGAGAERRGVIITGSSGAGKTTLVAELLRRRPDLSEQDPAARMLVSPERLRDGLEHRGGSGRARGVVVREPAGWVPPGREGEAVRALATEAGTGPAPPSRGLL